MYVCSTALKKGLRVQSVIVVQGIIYDSHSFLNPNQAGVSESLIRWGGGAFGPQKKIACMGINKLTRGLKAHKS